MIRLIEEKDIDDISLLLKEVNYVHYIGRPDLFKENNKYTKEELANMVNDKLNPIFVYETDGKVVGHAFCITKEVKNDNLLQDNKTLYIDDICVLSTYRNKGIASKLYEYVRDFAKNNGYYNITLNVWEINPGAKAFYEKMGLKPQKVTMEEILG